MPTGYTADVANGKVTDLKTFALTCARGMGALVMMRADPSDAPIPQQFEPSTYNLDRLTELRSERTRIEGMSRVEAIISIDSSRAEIAAENAKRVVENDEQRKRYDDMIAKVEAWTGAPDGIREFMLSQLRESISFDCGGRVYQTALPSTSVNEWKTKMFGEIDRQIAYHEKNHAEEMARTEARNTWIAQLRASLEWVA